MIPEQLINALYGAGGATGLWSVIQYFLNRRKEKRKENKQENRTDAETLKSLAETYSIKVQAEVLIAAQWEKLAQELRKELEQERHECDLKISGMEKKIGELKLEIEELRRNSKQN